MKKLLLFFFIGILAIPACKRDQSSQIDIVSLQKNLDADQEVAKLRSLLYGHARLLASIPMEEFDAITDKLHSCGIYGDTAPIDDVERCVSGLPSAEVYMDFQKMSRQYSAQYKVVENRFPDFAQLDHKKQAELLVPVNEEEAEKVLSDYLSNRKK